MPSKKPLIALRLSRELYDRVKGAAAADDRTVSNYVERLISALVPEHVPSKDRHGPVTTAESIAAERRWKRNLRPAKGK